MRALFVDANDSLAEVTERLLRPGDPSVSIHRDPDIAAEDLPRLLAGYQIAIDDHTQFRTDIVKQCPDLKHIVFLGTGARSYMNPEELEAIGVQVHIVKGYGDTDVAESLYVVCARTDANYIAPAAFGLARIRSARGDVPGAVRALDLVPGTSRAFTQARRTRAGLLAGSGGGLPSLAAALDSIESLTIDPVDRSRFRVEVLGAALGLVESHGADTSVVLAGRPASEPALRDGLETAYRDLALHTSSR